jgi:cytidine deaminase
MAEKNKRYNNCQVNYKALLDELKTIDTKVADLSADKQQISSAYQDIGKELNLTLKAAASKLIAMCRSFIADFCHQQKTIITYLAEKKFTLEKIELKTFFTSETHIQAAEFYDV